MEAILNIILRMLPDSCALSIIHSGSPDLPSATACSSFSMPALV